MANAFSITISAVDAASAKLEAINKRIGQLRAPIDRLNASFTRLANVSGLTKLGSAFAGVARASLAAFQSIARIVAPLSAITGAASVAGMYRLATAWAEFGSRLGFAAQRIGTSADQLQSLQGAARLAGSSSESLTSGMRTLGDTLVDAVGGRAPEAVVMMNTLGISFRNADGSARKASDVLPELADRIAAIKNPSLQARAATALLGGAAEDLLPFLRRGSAGMQEYTQQARFYGVINDRAAASALDLRQAQTRLMMAVEGLGNSISETLAPVLGPMLTQLANWIAKNREWIATGIGEEVKKFATWLQGIDWQQVGQGIKDLGTGIQRIVDLFGGWKNAAEDLMLFMAGKWLLGMLAPIGRVATAMAGVGGRAAAMASSVPGALPLGAVGVGAAMTSDLNSQLQKADPEHREAPWWSYLPGGDILWQHQVLNRRFPRGIRNNNPLNLTFAGQEGAIGSDGRFGIFSTQEGGIAAAERQLLKYQGRGLTTLSQMIGKWAPASENNSAAYIAAVAKQTGLDPNVPINMRDPNIAASVVGAMGQHETGIALDPGVVSRGVNQGINGKAQVTVRLEGFPPGTTTRASASGGIFAGAPRVEQAMPSYSAP